jgi:uncharacterized protein YjiK
MINKLIFFIIIFISICFSKEFTDDYNSKKIKILKTYELKGVEEVSDLAYDKQEDILYAISDKGVLYHIKLGNKKAKVIESKKLKLIEKSKKIDVEGFALKDNKLVISFERNPKISIFNTKGKEKDILKLPKEIDNIDDYIGENKMLEALAYNKKYGIITAKQNSNDKYHTVYSLSGTICKFQKDEDLSAFEFLDEDNIITIERKIKKDKAKNLYIKKVNLSKNCKSKNLLKLTAKEAKLFNYEGITKLDKNRFIIVNDNGSKDDTYLIIFETL